MIFARRALLQTGWARDVRLTLAAGRIATITPDAAPAPQDARVDTLLPALANLHSHSFQRAMAGLTERRAAGRDSFWSWRDLMYRFVAHLTPDQVQAIAALTFMEMQEAGYAAVGEFHYLHHAPGGTAYADPLNAMPRWSGRRAWRRAGCRRIPGWASRRIRCERLRPTNCRRF